MMLGINLQILLGENAKVEASSSILRSIKTIQVTNTDEGRDGFQISLAVPHNSLTEMNSNQLTGNDLLRPFSRIVMVVIFSTMKKVLIDGIITNIQYNPSHKAGESTMTITGEDISVKLDTHEKSRSHEGLSDDSIVSSIVGSSEYSPYGFEPDIHKPPSVETPLPEEKKPFQQSTDLNYILELTNKYNYVFYIQPTKSPGKNLVYWGPRDRSNIPQKTLTFNMGPFSNLLSINFQYNALQPVLITGSIQDKSSNEEELVETHEDSLDHIVSKTLLDIDKGSIRTKLFKSDGASDLNEALRQAQAETDKSFETVVTASGDLDTSSYGSILAPRKLVTLRGVGAGFDGLYYVKSVTHNLQHGEYKQSFNLSREGIGSTVSSVAP